MPPSPIDIKGFPKPAADGAVTEYLMPEVTRAPGYQASRKVIFINGMANSGDDHAQSALALSLVQLCTVIGVYNKSTSGWADFKQCVGDKNQFQGPLSLSASNRVAIGSLFNGGMPEQAAIDALSRNPCQVAVFRLLRRPENRRREIFAHSQGNLILSNALQAIAAVDGDQAVAGRVVNTFGSPTVNWPPGIRKYEHGFTFDPVNWLSGFDRTWSISKVGWPSGTHNPITHGFVWYLQEDPAFVVNRYRVGGWGMTFNMDEDGLADALAAMGPNTPRLLKIFEHLDANHNSDADDVAVRYVARIRNRPDVAQAIGRNRPLRDRLIKVMDEGYTSPEERRAIDWLRGL